MACAGLASVLCVRDNPGAPVPILRRYEMLRVTFYVYSPLLGREFRNVEIHRSIDDARLRACALNWSIEKIEEI